MRAAHRVVTLFSLAFATVTSAQEVEVVNNQPFDIRMPVQIRGLNLGTINTHSAQQYGDDAVFLVDVPASKSQTVSLAGGAAPRGMPVGVEPILNGVAITISDRKAGQLSWAIVSRPETAKPADQTEVKSTKRDFSEGFSPLPLKFEKTKGGAVFDSWQASHIGDGVKLDVTLLAYRSGFLDIKATFTNESKPTEKQYLAVVTRWEQPKVAARTLCYDNRRSDFADGGYSSFRAGEGRQQYIQRGVDWIYTKLEGGAGINWLNDFSPSFTVHRDKSEKMGPRWVGANTAQLGQEAQVKDGVLYSITEIARPNIKNYVPRLAENVLPSKDQPLTFISRLAFDREAVDADHADHAFVGYVGYNPQQATKDGGKISFGVPFTRMGTNYFPYSTLGENFGKYRMPGMAKENYWPLAPQTVLQWDKFADDIRRDLRTIKALGYDLVRLHHLEEIYRRDKKTNEYIIPVAKRWEYLDFLFAEMEKLGFKALLDVKLPPADVAELAARYRKLADGVEYDNEILLFQTFDEDIPVWKEVYDALKKVAPEMPFHLTAQTATGAFDRIAREGVKFDRLGLHAYMDGTDVLPSSRGYALAVGNYAAEHGKEPIITEWNWRFMTRMPMDERAKVYAPIFENVLAARTMPIVYQFQYNDTLAMNPATLKGIRRYEQILLSRRPKPEAFVMAGLIEKYGDPDSGFRKIGVEHEVLDLGTTNGTIGFRVTNRTDKPMPVKVSAETSADVSAKVGDAEIVLAPGKTTVVPVKVSLADGDKAMPGFYHVFLRIAGPDGTLRYGWAEVRKPGSPQMDRDESKDVAYAAGALDFNLNRPLTVVYPDEATVNELENTWTVFLTLESATGRPVEIFQASDFAKRPELAKRAVVLVTREKDAKPSVRVEGDKLIIAGADDKGVATAAMDYVLRYWKHAKDAGARKVGLVEGTDTEASGKTDLD